MAGHEHDTNHHVHFDENVVGGGDDPFIDDNSITISSVSNHPGQCSIHLGFLQVKHRYLIEIALPIKVLTKFDWKNSKLVVDDSAIPNIYCKLTEFLGYKNDFLEMKVEFFAHKEKLLKESLVVLFEDQKQQKREQLKLIISARVLGRGKGTPMLRNGIHCVGIEADDESEMSDWVGFSRNDVDEL